MTTITEARDEINGLLKGAVDAYNLATGKSIQVYYDDVDKAEAGGKDAHLRSFIRHADGDQDTFGGAGHRRFTRTGVVMVQVMTPFGDGFTLGDVLGIVARNAYEGVSTPNGVWFRRVAVKEVGKTGNFYQQNVTAYFEYTETR